MRSDPRVRWAGGWLLGIAVISPLLSGCGRLGLNPPTESTLEFKMGGEGCLNDLGRQLEQFAGGTIPESEWEGAWDCATQSFEQFKVYARGSEESGFTAGDLETLVSGFLITNRPIPGDLMEDVLRIKSGLLGGSSRVLSYEELDQVLELMAWAKEATSSLIPLLKERDYDPSARSLADLSLAIQRIADELAERLSKGKSFTLKWSELRELADKATSVIGLELPLDSMFAQAELGKNMLLAGSLEGIETSRIPDLIRMSAPVLATAIEYFSVTPAMLTGPNATAEFYYELANGIRPTLEAALRAHGGLFSLEWFDRILDLVPDSLTTTERGHVMDRTVLRDALRNVNWRFLRSKRRFDLDEGGFARIFDIFREWTRGQTLIETIYENAGSSDPAGMPRQVFLDAAIRLRPSLGPEDQVRLDRLTDMVARYHPLYLENEDEIYFGELPKYSLGTVSKFHLFRLIADEMLSAYSTQPGGKLATLGELEILVSEWVSLLTEIQKVDPTTSFLHERRFREGNLFTRVSNGDPYLDQDEITLYLAQMGSIGAMSTRIETVLNEPCGTDSFDIYGYRWMKARCFREGYFKGVDEYWKYMPGLLAYYKSLTPAFRRRFEIALETGARRYGYSDELLGEWDVQGFAGIAQYVEGMFRRYDMDSSAIINLDELMGAFPVFKRDLAAFGKIDPGQTLILEAAFTYTVRFGIPPTLDVMGGAHFVGWLATKPAWKINGDRAALYKVLAALNPKETPPEGVLIPPSGIQIVDPDAPELELELD